MKKALVISCCVLAVVLGMAYTLWQDGTKFNYGLIAYILFGLALAMGFIRRLILARSAGHSRNALTPLRDAGTTYERLVLGRPEEAPTEIVQEVEHSLPLDPSATEASANRHGSWRAG
ncbi:hypothetical protein [Glutamicibacter arilaitensis]|uniref:hypothetical protein n=1 Tax=Glutamicibacter arilaitensis TaxID=256701 RepID=UPI003A90131D